MIYVDCDDTLVLYLTDRTPNPYGVHMGTDWKRNDALIQALADIDGSELYVWSGGGSGYAEEWRKSLLPHAHHSGAKNPRLANPGDICIDDQRLNVDADCVTWQEYVAMLKHSQKS